MKEGDGGSLIVGARFGDGMGRQHVVRDPRYGAFPCTLEMLHTSLL